MNKTIDKFSRMSNNRFMNDFSSNMSNNANFSETKLQMAEALKRLIKDRPFSKITVQDIVIECNINRNTFYYHFENNYDLLSFTYSLEVKNIVDSFQKANASLPQAMDFVLDYIDKNISLCQCAYESLGEQQLTIIFERDLMRKSAAAGTATCTVRYRSRSEATPPSSSTFCCLFPCEWSSA